MEQRPILEGHVSSRHVLSFPLEGPAGPLHAGGSEGGLDGTDIPPATKGCGLRSPQHLLAIGPARACRCAPTSAGAQCICFERHASVIASAAQ